LAICDISTDFPTPGPAKMPIRWPRPQVCSASIARMLLKNVPIKLVASLHNTSTKMIEKHYAKYITEHSDDISRHALLHHEPPAADNVVALARGDLARLAVTA